MSEIRYFQWIAGDKRGQIQIFKQLEEEDGVVFILFKDGSRINANLVAEMNAEDLTGKFMAEVENMQNVWEFKDEWVGREEELWEQNAEGDQVCVQPFVEGRKVVKIIPPKQSNRRSAGFGLNDFKHAPAVQPPVVVEKIEKIDKTDPVYILMSKSKKSDSDINMAMTISLPPKSLYKLAKESFEEGDEKFIEYIVEEITVDQIKNALKLAIKQMYEYHDNIIATV